MSRLFSVIATMAASFAATEIAAMRPHVLAAYDELPADLTSADPIHAVLAIALSAYQKAKADPAVVPSLSGILGGAVSLVGGVVTSLFSGDPQPISPTATQEAAAPAAAIPAEAG